MKKCLLLGLILVGLGTGVQAGEVLAAVASNFEQPAREIAATFEKKTGHRVQIASGATGKLFAQIQNGAPFEIVLAADSATPVKMIAESLAVRGSEFPYAIGKLALWTAETGKLGSGEEWLRQGDFKKLAIANPKTAPYGAAADQVLNTLGLRESVTSKIVEGENIAQTLLFVSSGNAGLGFVALSQISKNGKLTTGAMWVVPQALYSPILQAAVLTERGRTNPIAQEFLDFLRSGEALEIIRSFGYGVPADGQ